MADTYSTRSRMRKIARAAYPGTWDTPLNADVIDIADAEQNGELSIDIGSSTSYELAALVDGTLSDSHYYSLIITGTPASAVTFTIPASVTRRKYQIKNSTGKTATVKYAASTGVVLGNGDQTIVWCDGSEVYDRGPGYRITPAETAAGVTIVDFSIPNHLATNGIFHPERYGQNALPGITDMSAAIAAAVLVALEALGGEVRLSNLDNYLGVTAIDVGQDVTISMRPGGRVLVNSSVPANMPQSYFNLVGRGSKVIGINGYIAANPFSTYAAKGALIGIGADDLDGIKILDCTSLWFMHGVFGSHTATDTANGIEDVEIAGCTFTSYATDVYHTGKSPTRFSIHHNRHIGVRPAPSNNAGAIGINAAVDIANVDNFTETNYNTDFGIGIHIHDNFVEDMKDRPIRVFNCKKLKVHDNTLNLGVGSYFTGGAGTTYSADAITFDLCRGIECHDNDIDGGGENGIDFLSCQDFDCHDNKIKRCNTDGVYVYMSDLYVSSATTPKLSSVTTRTSLQTKNGRVHDNLIESFIDVYVGVGQDVKVFNNQTKLWTGSSNWVTGASTPRHIAVDNDSAALYFAESAAHWMCNVEFTGNTPVLGRAVSVTCDNTTDTFTTVGGVAHGFVTGTLVESIAGGTANTVDFPGGLDYKVEYYAIRVSDTAFKLATSWVNAFAGTAIAISSNGLTVANSALLFREAVVAPSLSINTAYINAASNIKLDENIPGYTAVNLFSTLPVMNPGHLLLFSRSKHQLIRDPAVDFGTARYITDKYAEIPPLSSNGTTVYGISPYSWAAGGYQFAIGADPANIAGTPADGYIKTSIW